MCLKPQDSFGEVDKFFLDLQKVRQSVRGDSKHFFCGYFLKMEAFRSELLTGH